MGFGELAFILIFILFGLFNLIARLVISRARQRRRIAEAVKQKSPVSEESTEEKALSVKQSLSEVRQVLGGGSSDVQMQTLPESKRSEGIGVKMHGKEEGAIRERYVSRLVQREESSLEEESQKVESLQEEKFTKMESEILPTLDVSISDQLLSDIDFGGYSGGELQERGARNGWERIQSLPPLKRAILLSELLGKPKALEEKPPYRR